MDLIHLNTLSHLKVLMEISNVKKSYYNNEVDVAGLCLVSAASLLGIYTQMGYLTKLDYGELNDLVDYWDKKIEIKILETNNKTNSKIQ